MGGKGKVKKQKIVDIASWLGYLELVDVADTELCEAALSEELVSVWATDFPLSRASEDEGATDDEGMHLKQEIWIVWSWKPFN